MTPPEALKGWTLRVTLYRLKPVLIASSPNSSKEYWTELAGFDERIPIDQFFDVWDHHIEVACIALADMIRKDLEARTNAAN